MLLENVIRKRLFSCETKNPLLMLSENFIRKGFQFLPDDCVAAVTVAVAAYRRRKQRIINTNRLALVLGLLNEEDAVVSRKNICM